MAPTNPGLMEGARFGGYRIVRALGSGAFGAVYEAVREPLGKRVALKVLHAEMVRVDEVVARFRREAEIVARLEHPHIVGVFDIGEHEGLPFIAMEFLEGRTLEAEITQRGRLTMAETLACLLPVASALTTVHERSVVHRDLKPENIFLARLTTGESQPKLLDFGVAKMREGSAALTRTNAMMGTPYYMSPEQALESKHIDATSDQWALGVILFRCVTGRVPFHGDVLLHVLNAIASAPLPSMRAMEPSIYPGFEAAVNRALERDPSRRYPSVKDFARALLPYADAATQARWAGHFGTSVDALHAARVSGTPPVAATIAVSGPASFAHAPSQSANSTQAMVSGPMSTLAGTIETLTPQTTTRSARDEGKPRRRWVPVAAVAALLGVGGVVMAASGSDSTVPGASARPALTPTVITAPASAPAPSTLAPAIAPSAPAPAPVVAAPTPALIAHDESESADAQAVEPSSAGAVRRGRHRRRRRDSEPMVMTAPMGPAAPARPAPSVGGGTNGMGNL